MKQWRGGSAVKKRPRAVARRRGQDGTGALTLEELDAMMPLTLGLKARDVARVRALYAAVKQRPSRGRKDR